MGPIPPVDAIGIATALALLVLSTLFARAVRDAAPSQARRVLFSAGFFVLGILTVIGVPALLVTPAFALLRGLASGILLLIVPALLSAWVADGIAITLGARRTPPWLAGGIAAAIAITYAWLILLTGDLLSELGYVAFLPALVAAASAMVWWPYLPRPGEDPEQDGVSAIFD